MKQITAIVKPDGTVIIDAEGFIGHECRTITDALSEVLGEKKAEVLKPEYYLTLPHIRNPQIRR